MNVIKRVSFSLGIVIIYVMGTYIPLPFAEITKLEKNGMFVYESVPGTSVFHLEQDGTTMSFEVQGFEDSQITVELEAETEYQVFIDGASTGTMTTNLGGKLSFSVELDTNTKAEVKIVKC